MWAMMQKLRVCAMAMKSRAISVSVGEGSMLS
jgi:hypothetical protein